jgi:hypothetical protein
MSTRRPLIDQWPCRIIWRAWRREAAKPRRTSTLSKAALEDAQEVLAGDPGLARRLRVVRAELLLQHAVVAAGLLLLTQLHAVLGLLLAAAAVLARRI